MKRILTFTILGILGFGIIPAFLISIKDRIALSSAHLGKEIPRNQDSSNRESARPAPDSVRDSIPTPTQPPLPIPNQGQASEEEKARSQEAAKAHIEKLRKALRLTLRDKKYAYILHKEPELETELMNQILIMIKLRQDKTVEQVVREMIDQGRPEMLVTPQNEGERLKEVQEAIMAQIRRSSYEERRDLCSRAGGSFTGSAVYHGDLVEQFLRACVCTNTNSSIGNSPWSKPILFAVSCE